MPDDRLFHKRLGHSVKVNALSADEEIVWQTYVLAADDFGVMRFSADPLRDAHDRLSKRSEKIVFRMLERVVEVGLVQTFEHQNRLYCYQWDWQDWQKIRYALPTVNPRIPANILAECSIATQWLHTLWPGGGGRDNKLKNWKPDKTWTAPEWFDGSWNGSGNGGGNGSGNGSRPTRACRSDRPFPVPVPSKIVLRSNQLQLLPPSEVPTYSHENKPPHETRRDFLPVENANERPEQSAPDRVPSTLRDRETGDRSGADDQRQRVEGTHQGTRGETGMGRAVDDGAQRCAGAGGASTRTDVGSATDDSRAADTDEGTADGSPVAASAAVGRVHVAGGDREEPAGLRQLRAVVQGIVARRA
jgi:hypothetical protein